MKQISIGIRCITDKTKGYGNLSRCLILGEEIRKRNMDPIFLINNYKDAIKEVKKRKFSYKIIPFSKNYSNDVNFIKKKYGHKYFQIILVDMREFGEKLVNKLSKNFKTVLIDDAWALNANADIIINGTTIKKYHKYKKISYNTKIFVGTKYFIAYNQFQNHKKNLSNIHDKKKYTIVVSMGGSDINNITFIITKILLSLNNVNLRIIIGPFYKPIKKLKKLIQNKKNALLIKSSRSIWNEFEKADLVLSNTGSTLFELAIMRVPTLTIITSVHEQPYAKFFSKKRFSKNLGKWNDINEKIIRNEIIQILNNKQLRKKMSLQGGKIIDGKGLLRVSKIIEDFSKYN